MSSTMKRFLFLALVTVCSSAMIVPMHPRLARTVAKKHAHTVQQVRIPKHAPLKKQDVQTVVSIADCYFATTPGYNDVKKKVAISLKNNNQNSLRGYLFELEAAHELAIKRDQTVCAFHKRCAHPQYMYVREFDIITDWCAIECKCINWDSVQKSEYIAEQLATQFAEQAELVRSGTVDVPYFMVCSKNPIPIQWQVWFMQRSILYMECPS